MNKKTIKEYRAWKAMKSRCKSPSANIGVYKTITVCDRWINSYENFLSDMGSAPTEKHSLDRIDNTKGYFPENCRWVTQDEQCKNRGTFNKVFTYNGESLVLKDWARKLEINYTTLYNRIYKYNMSFEEAIRFTREYEYNGFKGSIKEICNKFSKVSYDNVINRINRGWDLHKALTTDLIK